MSNSSAKFNLYGYAVYDAYTDIADAATGTIIGTALVPAGHRIRVTSANINMAGNTGTSFVFIDDTGTAQYGTQYHDTVLDHNPAGWFECDTGDGLVGTVSGATMSVSVNYVLIDS